MVMVWKVARQFLAGVSALGSVVCTGLLAALLVLLAMAELGLWNPGAVTFYGDN